MYSAGSIAPSNARDFPSSMPPDHISPVSAPSAQNPWERQSYSNSNTNSNSISRDRFPSSGKKELWGSEHRSSSQRSSSSSSSSFSSNNKRRAPGFTGRHGAVENGRYGVAVSRPLDSSSIRSSENGKAERDTFCLSGGYISSPNADKHIKDTDGLHFRDTHITPVDLRTVSSPHYDPSPRNGNQNSFEILGSREGERLKSSSSHYSWGVSHRDQEFREKNVGRPDHYRRACPLPKLDSSREWSVENREMLEGRIDRYGSASNREPLFSEVCKDQSRHEWRNRDRGLYSGLSSRMPTYPSKSHPRDIGIVSARSEALGVISPKEETMVQNSQMHVLNAEDPISNSKKRPRLTWGQGLAKYEKEKTEEDPLAQKKYEDMKIAEKDPLGQKIFNEVKTWDKSSTEKKAEVDTEERCESNGDLQSRLSLSRNEPLVDSENNDVHLEQGDAQEQCKQNEGLQSQFNVSTNEHMIMTDTKENGIQGEHCHIQGLCKQNGGLQSQLNISSDEHIVIEDTGNNVIQGELRDTPSQEPTIDCSTEEFVMDTLVMKHNDFSKSADGAEGFLRDYSQAADSTEPNSQCLQSFMEGFQGTIPNVSKVVLKQYVKKVELEIDSLEKQIIKLENEQGTVTGYGEKMEVEVDLGKEIHKQNDEYGAVIIHSRDSGANSSLELPERFLDSPAPSVQQPFPEANSVSQSGNVPIEELPNPSCSILHESVKIQRLENEMDQKVNEIIEQDRSLVKEIVMSIPSAISSDSASHIMLRNSEDIRDTNRNGEDMVSSLLLSNQETARKASDALAHLYPAGINLIFNERRIYGVPEEADIWKYNAESHQKKRKVLESKVAEETKSAVIGELALVIRNRTKKELWKRGLVGCLHKGRSMDPQHWIPEQKSVDASTQPCSVKQGCSTTEASPEEVQLAKKLLSVLPAKERGFLRMPSMILGKHQRKHHSFETNNALVEDPVAAERERKIMNPWSAEEKKIFLEKYLLLGKNLRRIATFLEYKTVADCVQFYYLNQKSEDFEKVHRKHLLKKRRDSRSSALYLATTISNNRQCEADAACLEGLSLVAAAAAAMSSTRVVRASPVASSKVYRERTLNKQALGTCALTGMAGNGEQIVSKTPRSWNSRSHRGLNGDSESQWTDNERELFLKAVPMFGKDFHNISLYIGTKNQGQCKSFFSKARKRLALDQLVEMYKAAIEAENEQKANTECATAFKVGVVKHAKAQKSSPDVDMQSPFLVSEIQCSTPQKEPDLGNICASTDLKPLGEPKFHPDLREAEDVKTVLNIDATNKQGPTPDVDSAGISCANQKIPVFEESQVCGELKPDLLNVKAEPLVSSNFTNVSSSNATSPLVHVIALPVSGPVLAPNTPSVSSVVPSTHIAQPTHIKEKSSKGTETRTRREPTSWTQDEKDIFIDVLRTHGKNWERLRERLPAKSLTQIKTYFQNSKAKLTLECEGVVTGNGRATLGKKKADDSDSSTNPVSGGQSAARKASTASEEGSLKVCPSVLDSGGNTTHVETLTVTGKKFMEESINAHKSLQSVGLVSHTSATGMLPMLSAPVFGMPSTQHSYVSMIMPPSQQLLPSIIMTHPASPSGISQPHQLEQQQPMVRTHAELLPMPHLSNFQQSQTNQQPSLQQLQQLRGIADLGPQSIQWQQQQLQLAIDQVSHNLRHVLNQQQQLQSTQPISSQALNQLSLTTSQGVGSHFASAKFSPSAQQSDPHQSQLYQIQSNPQLLPQQQEQALQLQLMQLHWQQQQSQLQQVQSQALMEVQAQARIQAEESQTQSHHKIYAPMNEQQQTVPFKEFIHSSPGAETCELDCPSLIKSHHSISEDAHVSQSSETLSTVQTIQDVHHVKLFGQSLFLQTDSSNQQPNTKVTPMSPPALISGRSQTDDTHTKVSTNALNLGHTPTQNLRSIPSVNGGLISELEHRRQKMSNPRTSNKVTHMHGTDENRISDVSLPNNNHVQENQGDSGSLENGILSASANLSSVQPTEMSDMTVNQNRLQESSNSTKILNGQPMVTQALPRVIDALVALAEWRLQNSSGGSGKLTDEFLSQSWEALQRDPSAFLEAGKASESLAQLCPGGAEMLQQLKDGFIHRNADVAGTIKARDVDEKNRPPSE